MSAKILVENLSSKAISRLASVPDLTKFNGYSSGISPAQDFLYLQY